MSDPARPALSVVAPCFNEEGVLPEFVRRVGAVLEQAGGTAEIVLVDDGSRDGTWELMTAAAAADKRIVAVRLMRNHGHQLALTAGLSICRGERCVFAPPKIPPKLPNPDAPKGDQPNSPAPKGPSQRRSHCAASRPSRRPLRSVDL